MSEECLKDSLDSSLGSQCDLFASLTQPLGNLVCASDLASQLSHEQYDSDETILSVVSTDLPNTATAKQVEAFSLGSALNETVGTDAAGCCSQELFTQIDSTQNFASCETPTPDGFQSVVSVSQQTGKDGQKRRKKRKRVCYNPRYQYQQIQSRLSQPILRKNNNKDKIFKNHCSLMEELNLIEAKFATINLLISISNFEQADLVLQNQVQKRLLHIQSSLHEKPLESDSSESDSETRGERTDLLEVREQRLRYLLLKADGIEKAITEAKDKVEQSQSNEDASQSIIPSLRQRPNSQTKKPNRPFINRKCASKFIRVSGIQSRLPNAVKKVRGLAHSNSQPIKEVKKNNAANNLKSQNPSTSLFSCPGTSHQATAIPLHDIAYSDVYEMDDSTLGGDLVPGGQLARGNSGAIVKTTPRVTVPRKKVELQNGQWVTVRTTPSPQTAPAECDFKALVKRGFVTKAKDVLRCCLEGNEYVGSVVGPGLILSSSLDVYPTPEGWLRAVSNLSVTTEMAYRKTYCGGVSLHELRQKALFQSSVIDNTTTRPNPTYSVLGRPFHIKIASPLSKATTSKKPGARRELLPESLAGKPLPKAPSDPLVDDLCDYLSRCRVVLPRDDELFVTRNLLGDNSDQEFAAMEDLLTT